MHWLVPANRAREFKLRLENLELSPKLAKVGDKVHLSVAQLPKADLGDLPVPTADPGCTMCQVEPKAQTPRLKYAVYPPMILFSTGVSIDDAQRILDQERCTHAAINQPIPVDDIVRRPQITPLIGDFGQFDPEGDFEQAFWCTCKQNGIYQTWAPLYTMFSRGNVTEKKRVLELPNIKDNNIVDLYCGIGYFTFSYAKAGANVVYGWELNRWSVEGLRRAALVNKWNVKVLQPNKDYEPASNDQIVVFNESNDHAPRRLGKLGHPRIAHVNLGLLPDCRLAWDLAKSIANGGTAYHIHENVHERDLEKWTQEISAEFGPLSHVEKIKQFAPGVWHLCGDAHDAGGARHGMA